LASAVAAVVRATGAAVAEKIVLLLRYLESLKVENFIHLLDISC
jgi:hypothetical protein